MKNVLKKIFYTRKYAFIVVIIFFIFLDITLLFQNFSLIWQTWQSFGFGKAFEVSLFLLGSLGTNFNIFTGGTLIIICFLFALNVALIIYLYDQRKVLVKVGSGEAGTTTLGLITGVLGIGCASCGSLVLTTALSAVGLGGVLAFLPWKGEEFIFLGAILLFISTWQLLNKAKNPFICN